MSRDLCVDFCGDSWRDFLPSRQNRVQATLFPPVIGMRHARLKRLAESRDLQRDVFSLEDHHQQSETALFVFYCDMIKAL